MQFQQLGLLVAEGGHQLVLQMQVALLVASVDAGSVHASLEALADKDYGFQRLVDGLEPEGSHEVERGSPADTVAYGDRKDTAGILVDTVAYGRRERTELLVGLVDNPDKNHAVANATQRFPFPGGAKL